MNLVDLTKFLLMISVSWPFCTNFLIQFFKYLYWLKLHLQVAYSPTYIQTFKLPYELGLINCGINHFPPFHHQLFHSFVLILNGCLLYGLVNSRQCFVQFKSFGSLYNFACFWFLENKQNSRWPLLLYLKTTKLHVWVCLITMHFQYMIHLWNEIRFLGIR